MHEFALYGVQSERILQYWPKVQVSLAPVPLLSRDRYQNRDVLRLKAHHHRFWLVPKAADGVADVEGVEDTPSGPGTTPPSGIAGGPFGKK